MKKTVLCVSFDETVSASRRLVLKEAGYSVAATIRTADALEMLSSVFFDLLVVGHRFPAADKHQLASVAREKGTLVLLICGAAADSDIPADARVYALEGTAGLVAAAFGLLAKMPAKKAAPAA